jgi:predicted HicB family RNase H-like nuclease
MTEPSYPLTELRPSAGDHRRRGRPPALEPSTSLTVWIPTKYYDRLARAANGRDQSLSALVRQILVMQLGSERGR